MTTVHNFFTRPVRYTMQARGKILDGNETVSDAVDTMKECDIGFVIVKLDDGKVGVVTESDLVFKVIGAALDPKKTRLKDVATRDPVTVNQNMSLEYALKCMRDKKVRRLIVVDNKNIPVGRLDQKFFFRSLVNVATGGSDLVSHSWIERYINDIVEHNVSVK
ncbi:MAG TPA: CBS domain-containing protein [Candidatus Methanomethylicus sp.]|nr:CBS domain-containing protein [Candidatus Methanomethylicus sp.]